MIPVVDGRSGEQGASSRLLERRQRVMPGSHLFYRDPLHVVRAEGVYLYTADGRRYLDCYNNVQSMGHGNAVIADAICQQSRQLTTHTRYLNDVVVATAEKALATLPARFEVCVFTCTGTEACELAMRMARAVTGKSGAVVLEHSYHGNSRLVGEMSTMKYPAEQRPVHIQAIAPPDLDRGPLDAPAGAAGQAYADLLPPAIAELERAGPGFAAFVCDTIFDSNGALPVPADYLTAVQQHVHRANGLLIADEVQAGVCRTGTFWGFEHHGIAPDIVFTGKPFGGGYPVAAVFTTRDIAEQWAARDAYFNTFGGNPVAAAAAGAVLDYAKEHGICEHVTRVGSYLQSQLQALAARHAMIHRVQGRGLFQCVDIADPAAARSPAPHLAQAVVETMKEEGVLIGVTGRYDNCLKFRPPLIIDEAAVDFAVAALDRALASA